MKGTVENCCVVEKSTTVTQLEKEQLFYVFYNMVAIIKLIFPIFVAAVAAKVVNSLPLCQFSGYCKSSSDCVAGNRCNIQSVYYSQCLADPTTYSSKAGCLSNFGEHCSVSANCCDPGAFCDKTTNPSFPQCKQPTSLSGNRTLNYERTYFLY